MDWFWLKSSIAQKLYYIHQSVIRFLRNIFGNPTMRDHRCTQEVIDRWVIRLLGVDDDPVPSMMHLDKELFVVTESIPRLKEYIKFSPSVNGPHCEAIYDSVGHSSSYFGRFILDNDGVRLTSEGKDSYNQDLNKKRESPHFDEYMSVLELTRIFFDHLTQDELLLILRDYHKDYFVQHTNDEESRKHTQKLSSDLLRRNLITESRYKELVGHPVE